MLWFEACSDGVVFWFMWVKTNESRSVLCKWVVS
jgi:hypothetical protein